MELTTPYEDIDRCRCGEMIGKVYEGETCPLCNTKIEFKDVDLKTTGWIKLGKYKIIQPAYYGKLASIIGSKQFEEIIEYDKIVDKNGHLKSPEAPSTPFKGIGLVEFRERFDEILAYYKQKKKNKLEEIRELEEDADKIFTSSIPVYSSVLRPLSFRGDALFYSTIDKKYNAIFANAKLLTDSTLYEQRRKKWSKEKKERMEVPKILSSIQQKMMDLWELIFEQIDQKDGKRIMILVSLLPVSLLIAGNSLEL